LKINTQLRLYDTCYKIKTIIHTPLQLAKKLWYTYGRNMQKVSPKATRAFLALNSFLRQRKFLLLATFVLAGIFVFANPSFAAMSISDGIMRGMTWIFMNLASMVGLLVIYLIDIMITIAQYNNFSNSNVIQMGWIIVRDIVNLFFVVILLIIAFGTMFNLGKINWRQQLPRLLIAAVLVNFSRMICDLLIDFGQVIMMTFVNAIRYTAAGNFVSLAQLQNAFTVSQTGEGSITGFDLFVSAGLALIMMVIVLFIITAILAILVYRIVILWVLVILSPLAFFLGGAKDVLGQAGSGYSDWWKKFSGAITVGPILMFFLWLALAAAGSGALAQNEGILDASDETSDELVLQPGTTKMLEKSQFTSFIVAIALLFAGLEAAQGAASSMGGFAAAAVGMAGAFSAKALSAPAAAAGYVGGRTAGAAGRVGKAGFIAAGDRVRLRERTLGGVAKLAARTGVPGSARLAAAAARAQGAAMKPRLERHKARVADMAAINDPTILAQRAAGGGMGAAAAQEALIKNGLAQFKLSKTAEGRDQLEQVFSAAKDNKYFQDHVDDDTDVSEAYGKAKRSNVAYLSGEDQEKTLNLITPQNAKDIRSDSLSNPAVWKFLAEKNATVGGRDASYLEHMEKGRIGTQYHRDEIAKHADTSFSEPDPEDKSKFNNPRDRYALGPQEAAVEAPKTEAKMATEIRTGSLKAADISVEQLKDVKVAKAVLDTGNAKFLQSLSSQQMTAISDAYTKAERGREVPVVKEVIKDGKAEMVPTGAMTTEMDHSPEDLAKMRAGMFAMTGDASADLDYDRASGRFRSDEGRSTLQAVVKSNPTNVFNLSVDDIQGDSSSPFKGEAAGVIAEEMTPEKLQQVVKEVRMHEGTKQEDEYKAKLEAIRSSIQKRKDTRDVGEEDLNKQLEKSLKYLKRQKGLFKDEEVKGSKSKWDDIARGE